MPFLASGILFHLPSLCSWPTAATNLWPSSEKARPFTNPSSSTDPISSRPRNPSRPRQRRIRPSHEPEANKSDMGKVATALIQFGVPLPVSKPWAAVRVHSGFFFITPHNEMCLEKDRNNLLPALFQGVLLSPHPSSPQVTKCSSLISRTESTEVAGPL